MKRVLLKKCFVLLIVAIVCLCACAAYEQPAGMAFLNDVPLWQKVALRAALAVRPTEKKDYAMNDSQGGSSFDPAHATAKIMVIPLFFVPDYLKPSYYDPDGIYLPEVACYDKFISNAKLITVIKRLWDEPLWGDKQVFFFYKGTFLSDNNENAEEMCKKLPLVRKTVKYDRFEFLVYDAREKINYISAAPSEIVFSVIKDRGKTVWFFEGKAPRDIAITKDGKYMIATAEAVFYAVPAGKKIINEMYADARKYQEDSELPDDIKILTDNVIRVSYRNGLVEHWKVRLTGEDIEKNLKALNKKKKYDADRYMLWSNGKEGAHLNHKMWCYYESEEEPVYKDTNLADISAVVDDIG